MDAAMRSRAGSLARWREVTLDRLGGAPAGGTTVVNLDVIAATTHPDAVRIRVALAGSRFRSVPGLTVVINQCGTRYFEEDIIQLVQLTGHGVSRLVIPNVTGAVQVRTAGELLDEIESRFPVEQPLSLGVMVAGNADPGGMEDACTASRRVDALVVDMRAWSPEPRAVVQVAGALAARLGINAVARSDHSDAELRALGFTARWGN
jgi:hypothetical protein